MYYQLSSAMCDRFVQELRTYWSFQPDYKDFLPGGIQRKHAFKERPQASIIVKSGGGSPVRLAADNYLGMVPSYVYQARYHNKPGLALEWVREDARAIQDNNGVFPSPPGIYYLELTEANQFMVNPLLEIAHEQVSVLDFEGGIYQTATPYVPGSLRLSEMPNRFPLHEATGLVQDPATGMITLPHPLQAGRWLEADYRVIAPPTGPFGILSNRANNRAIPGVVLAFGRALEKGDRMAVVVQKIREPAYMAYGGRWSLNMDLDVTARDVHDQGYIADRTAMFILGVLRASLIQEGLEIQEVSLGGESEEVYDENADDYSYMCSIAVTLETEWEMHVPIEAYIRQAVPLTKADIARIGGLHPDALQGETGNIKALEGLRLEAVSDPFFVNRSRAYEVIR